MQALTLREKCVQQLARLDKNLEHLSKASPEAIDWSDLKRNIGQQARQHQKNLKFQEPVAYLLVGLILVIVTLKLLDITDKPDLDKGLLIIVFTVSNLYSALSQKLRLAKLEQQLFLIELLETSTQQQPVQA